MRTLPLTLVAAAAFLTAACTTTAPVTPAAAPQETAAPTEANPPMETVEINIPRQPTVEEASQFVNDAEARLAAINVDANRASWVQATYITYDTQILAAKENERLINADVELAKQAARFDKLELPYDVRRKLDLLKLSLTSPGPADPALTAEMARIASELEATYGAGKYCPPGKSGEDCLDIDEIDEHPAHQPRSGGAEGGLGGLALDLAADARRLRALRRALERGRARARLRRHRRAVALDYDMPPDDFAAETDRLWAQVEPLYKNLHCYVRAS